MDGGYPPGRDDRNMTEEVMRVLFFPLYYKL